MELLKKVLLAVLVGLVAYGLTYLIGLILALIPFLQPIGGFIMLVSPIVGVIAGVWYFLTGRQNVL